MTILTSPVLLGDLIDCVKCINEIWNMVLLTTKIIPYNRNETTSEGASGQKYSTQSFSKYPTYSILSSKI